MKHRKAATAIGVTAGVGITDITVAATAGGSAAKTASAKAAGQNLAPQAPADSTIQVTSAVVNGKVEPILADARGQPLYFYTLDLAAKSLVSGALAAEWPPLLSGNPSISGANGALTVLRDASGTQVAYNSHFLYTFVGDSPDHVMGQGVQDFFVATPGLSQIGAPSPTTNTAPASQYGGGYGY
ncbi:MAG TPA: hypothetical protein VKR22_01910 [Acidimicrobiales bacterium]|nr:hypothetical protein [Acidimicrobiales bacterium]